MVRKKVISVALAALLTTGTVFGEHPGLYQSMLAKAKTTTASETKVTMDEKQVDADEYGLADNIQDGTILHCFDWKYTDIKAELKNIAEAGFSAVQTSPAQRGDGLVWYWLYQPQTFSIQPNAIGNKSELEDLCKEAKKYGIKIVVDVVANHTRSIGDDGLGGDCFHQDNGDIDYTNRYQITHWRIGMPDLNSESTTVQNKVKGYIQELKEAGVEGIRWDAAKHIGLPSENCQFWPAVTSLGLYNYGEILNGPCNGSGNNDALMKEYTNYISVTDDEYGDGILKTIKNGGVSGNSGNYSNRGVAKNKLVYWAESHDTYSNNGEYGKQTAYDSENAIDRTYALLAGQGDATSLYFSRPFEKDKQNIKAGEKGSTHFTAKEVAAVNHLHNACVGEKDYMVAENGVAAVCRESGAVIVKGSGSGQVTIKNGGGLTEPGTYTDEVSGNTFTVTSDTISGTVGDTGIAAFYNGGNMKKNPKVTASKASGTFSEPFELTLTPANADKATYSINGGEAVEFTKATKVKIGEGCNIGDKVTVKVTASGEGDPFEETFTYTMAEVPVAKFLVRVKKSDFSSAPYIYAFSKGDTVKEHAGGWPGTQMTEDGDYYVYSSDDIDSATVILSDGNNGWRNTQEGETEVVVNGMMEYDKSSNKFTTITLPQKTPVATVEPTPTVTSTVKPTPVVTATAKPTPVVTATTEPTATPTTKVTVEASLKNGSTFTTETADVKITLKNAENGTYRVDNGPIKSFKNSTTVTIGQGMIADKDVTLEVTAISGKSEITKKFTYRKVFDGTTAQVKTAAVTKIKSLMEVVAEAAQNSAEDISGEPTSSYFATNPNKQTGSKKTITKASDFTEDMIIAQGVANDGVTSFKGSHEGPVYDSYAMFGAYDDSNVYIGIQYVNVIDVIDPAQGYPISDNGKPYNGEIPQMMVFDTKTGDYTDGTANDTKQKTAWDIDVKFSGDTKVDKVYTYAAKPEANNKALFPVTNGIVDYTKVMFSKKGTDSGITYSYEDGFFCSKMYGINGNGYDGYKPSDLNDESANWIDFLTTSHDTEKDTFMLMTIPMSALGVTADKIESEGIGVMSISTFGESGIGSLPQDLTMLDHVSEDYVSKKGDSDPSTSLEKADSDIVTVPLAQLGGTYDGPVKTKNPSTPKPTDTATTTPDNADVVTTPEATNDVVITPVASEAPGRATPTPTPKATAEPTKPADTEAPATEEPEATSNPGSKFTVNFGADRSSPQYASTKLELKAIPYGATGDCKYEFFVDGKTVQASSEKATYSWNGEVGKHTIKVVVTDTAGNKISSEKQYVIEQNGTNPTVVPTATATTTPKVTVTPTATVQPTAPVVETPQPLSIRMKLSAASPQKLGKKVSMQLIANGGTAPYTYSIVITNSAGKKKTVLKSTTKNTVTWKADKAGKYKITATVTDANGVKCVKNTTYTITAVSPITVKTFKVSSYKVKKGKTVKITVKATSTNKGKIQYKLSVQKNGSTKRTVVKSYSTKTTCTWKAKKKGKYTVYLTVKDSKGKTTTKKLTKQITVK